MIENKYSQKAEKIFIKFQIVKNDVFVIRLRIEMKNCKTKLKNSICLNHLSQFRKYINITVAKQLNKLKNKKSSFIQLIKIKHIQLAINNDDVSSKFTLLTIKMANQMQKYTLITG